ncbi:MAG: SCP2 sterol-binding domain-containing protein [Gammaproteobacteria bacterium]|nr:SCP2 sterol-binding domain-containing protein [Gammaproteobacteria bacterium]
MSLVLKPLSHFLRFIPDKVHTRLISRVGGHFMQGQAITSRLDYMEGKRLQLSITDTKNCWKFVIRNHRLVDDAQSKDVADVHIQGDLKTFLLLATGNEDPDSLFFSRHLSLEGNTEDGLYIKNLIDAMDFDTNVYLQQILGQTLAAKIAPLVDRLDLSKRFHHLGERLFMKH